MHPVLIPLVVSLLAAVATDAGAAAAIDSLRVPQGFHVDVYADGVASARELALGADGTVFAGSRDAGKVYAISDIDHDGRADKVRVIVSGLKLPSGIAFHGGDPYVGAVGTIYALRDIEHHFDDPPKPAVVTDKLPSETHHGWKFLGLGPNGRLYVPIGTPCNICIPNAEHGKIISMKADGSDWQDVAVGVRNSVRFDWQPDTGQLWFTDNGRDMLGDDLPSDELNRVSKRGEHFGYPYCHQGDTLDPEFGAGKSCKDYTPPMVKLGAHVASIGMRSCAGKMFPAAYRGAAIIAEHGSWNRSTKSGYWVVAVPIDDVSIGEQKPLLDGFLRAEHVAGRPADALVMPDGAMLVSDDDNGAIYRISFQANGTRR